MGVVPGFVSGFTIPRDEVSSQAMLELEKNKTVPVIP